MKRIKIIDLLNMISKGEEVPKKIKLNGCIFVLQGDDYLFKDKTCKRHWLFSDSYTHKYQWLNNFLKAEVEILEEEKKLPEKLDEYDTANEILIIIKINEIIDYLESKEKGE